MPTQLAATNTIFGPVHFAGHHTTTQKTVQNCPFVRANHILTPLQDNLLIEDGQYVETSAWANAQELHASTAISVQHAMEITLGFNVQETGVGPLSNSALEPRRSPTFECDTAHTR